MDRNNYVYCNWDLDKVIGPYHYDFMERMVDRMYFMNDKPMGPFSRPTPPEHE